MMIQKIIDEKPDIITGDFNSGKHRNSDRLKNIYWTNIDLKNTLREKDALKFLNSPHELLKEKNFIPVVDNIASTTPFAITPDWIYIDKEKKYKIIASGVIETGASKNQLDISDHDFIYCILEI